MADFISIQENTNQTQNSESNLASAIANLETKVDTVNNTVDNNVIPTLNTIKNASVIKRIRNGYVSNTTRTSGVSVSISLNPEIDQNKTLILISGGQAYGSTGEDSRALVYTISPWISTISNTSFTIRNVYGNVSYQIIEFY